MKVCILKSRVGNFKSVSSFFKELNYRVNLSNKINDIMSADLLVIPGAGSFEGFMNSYNTNIIDAIKNRKEQSKLIFGICAGFQVLFSNSDESHKIKGLNLIKGKIVKLKSGKERLPHLGWYKTTFNKKKDLNNLYYYVNNYGLKFCKSFSDISYYTFNNTKYISAFRKDNIIASQFHPEKSSNAGIKFFKEFVLS